MLKYNGTEVKRVIYNGTEIKRVVYNGTEVFRNTGLQIPAGTYSNAAFIPIIESIFGRTSNENRITKRATSTVNVTVNNQTITVNRGDKVVLTCCGSSPFNVEGLVFTNEHRDGSVVVASCVPTYGFKNQRTYLLRKATVGNQFAAGCSAFTIKFSGDLNFQ